LGKGESVDAAVLSNPIPGLYMVWMGILGESSGFCLLRREEPLLLLSYIEQPSRRVFVRIGRRTLLQLF
jgi:hypothetical protein